MELTARGASELGGDERADHLHDGDLLLAAHLRRRDETLPPGNRETRPDPKMPLFPRLGKNLFVIFGAYAGFGPASKALRERANPAKAGRIQAYSGRTLKAPPKTWQKPAPRGIRRP